MHWPHLELLSSSKGQGHRRARLFLIAFYCSVSAKENLNLLGCIIMPARLVLGLDRRAHITPALKRLHWLPVKYRVLLKLATLMHRCLHRCCPAYTGKLDIVTFNDSDTAVHRLRSSTTRVAAVKRTRTQFGRKAFSVAGPDIWNSLLPQIRLTENFLTFKKKLKTHLFDRTFS